MVQEVTPQELFQPVRSVHQTLRLSAIAPPTTDDIFYVVCYVDPETHKHFVFWGDILQAFEKGLHARDGAKMVPFLRGSDLRILKPRRIAAVPSTVLDVVVGGPLVDTEVTSPRNAPEAIGNSHISRPAATSAARGSQTWSYVPPPIDKDSLMIHQSGAVTNAHSLGSQEYHPSTSSAARSPGPQGYSTPGMDFTKAVVSASKGDRAAQVALGDMYKDGQGVYQDYRTSMDWYLKAANQGDSEGQYKVGAMYSIGLGVPQDYIQAMTWFLKAADQGHAVAQYNIGLYYDVGRGVSRDSSKAEEWYQKAADQGNTDAKKMLDGMSKKDLTVD